MDMHQHCLDGSINIDTGICFPVLILIDTSGSMGEYHPQIVENSVNSFLMRIGKYKLIDKFVDVCLYESHDEFEYLAGFGNPSNYVVKGIRYGGKWNLIEDFIRAINVIQDTIRLYNRTGKAFAGSLIIVLSDNLVPDEIEISSDFVEVNNNKNNALSLPKCLFLTSKENNDFVNYYDNMELKPASKESLQKCMIEIADDIIDVVRSANSMG